MIRHLPAAVAAVLLCGCPSEQPASPESNPVVSDAQQAAAGEMALPDVVKVGDHAFLISNELRQQQFSTVDAVSSFGRALLHRGPDGGFDGYRLSRIRRGSLPDQLGIENGDILQKVNDLPLTSMQSTRQAYSQLQGEVDFELQVSRRGEDITLSYVVR